MMIKKILHQYWDGILPDQYKNFSENFQLLNPHFNYFLWNKELVLSKCTDHILYKHLKESNNPIASSDIARIILLDIFGGIYFDSDMRPEQSIPEWILHNAAFSCYENEKSLGQTIANGVAGSEPNGIFIKNLINEVVKISLTKVKEIKSSNSWLVLGPRLWTKVFFDSLSDQCITIYPSWYFIPYHYALQEPEKKGYITTHIWRKEYQERDYVTHYGHGKKILIINDNNDLKYFQSSFCSFTK